ncbi:glycosyltransferase BC10 isoform X1 [Ziziphus jujuba]|uniref:Glycosyltransferase BC10 isoform X1 n=1 Tax=Ziziphus jujuba TaxID=326968 RepID=A0A6P3ZV06_ZIZJJ|nr:glycosyltransferase BC10 isoform X1 [Ziziphus jujuba]XP_048323385.1 glycosyltransferase BC10 isoform X1 [Ziziphus jujuba]XP_048323386.1 glycosyltransferase BC10-like isoform X1 [Ziziphus jujuba var. spinosa]
MTKKAPPIPARHVIWFGWKLVIFFSVALCLVALLKLHSQPPDLSSSVASRSRSRISRPNIFTGPPKIAFLFLARRNLPLDFLWGNFFEDADVEKFSIYIHSTPGFVFDETNTKSHFFRGRQLRNSIRVAWGESSMIQAERLLLEAALEDPASQRFVLLSDSCVPLYNFSYIYNYVMASPRSFVDSFLDAKEGRYNPKMSPRIPKNKWRKGSQWITLVREHAEVIVDDEVIFPVFQKFCKRRPLLDASKGKMNAKLQKQHNCIPDEHYVPTLLAMSELESELERRTLTYTSWNLSATKMETKGWHPTTFTYANSGPEKIREIKNLNHVYYETEFRTEWCRSNSTSVPCFLFARKFSQAAAMRLLGEGVVGRFGAATLLDAPP